MRGVLISCYEMGRQPFGLASAAAWLRHSGCHVTCLDLAVEPLEEEAISAADLLAVHVPMHTATRMAVRLLGRLRALAPGARVCFFGLYASLNESFLRRRGVDFVLGGEFETALAALALRISEGASARQVEPVVSLARQEFRVPDRRDLPPLDKYARLRVGPDDFRAVGATEASRGCKHLCRHCPIVPVYGGRFRVVPPRVVLEDVRRQVAAGARHITFGDPDFLNGVGHARRVVEALHADLPELTFDITVKVEHILKHAALLPWLVDRGCILVTSAIESFDDAVLVRLDKGHTRADALRAVELCREAGLPLSPTFVPFTPWTDRAGYAEFLTLLEAHDLDEHVAPVQLAVRLLVPAGSRLLELSEVRELTGPFDEEGLVHPWSHPDARMDRLQRDVEATVAQAARAGQPRREIFDRVLALAGRTRAQGPRPGRAAIPWMTEPWFC